MKVTLKGFMNDEEEVIVVPDIFPTPKVVIWHGKVYIIGEDMIEYNAVPFFVASKKNPKPTLYDANGDFVAND